MLYITGPHNALRPQVFFCPLMAEYRAFFKHKMPLGFNSISALHENDGNGKEATVNRLLDGSMYPG
jgi:hypothetical protein